jgi:probable F420-dependent oxidoreductase
VRLGVVFPHRDLSGDPMAIRAHAQAAEAAGYDHYLAYDHVLGAQRDRPGGFTGPYDHETPFTEPMVLFAHLAAVTTFLELVTGIIILPQRQTALVAKQAADLQILSRGRLRLGVGVGWNRVEYEGLGQDFRTRGRRMAEQVELLRRLFTEPVVDFDGRFDRIPLAGIAPRPPRHIPIWMGGGSPAVLDRIGRLADGWFPQVPTPADLEVPLATIRHAAEESGRNPRDIGVNPQLRLSADIAHDVDLALGWREAGATHLSVSTVHLGARVSQNPTPADHIEAIEEFKEAWDRAQ